MHQILFFPIMIIASIALVLPFADFNLWRNDDVV